MPRTTRKTRKKGPGLAPTVDVALVNNLPEQFNNESEYIFKSQHHHRSYIWAEPEATIVKSEQVTPVRKGAVPVARELPREHFIDANEIYEEIRDLKMIITSIAQRMETLQFQFEKTEIKVNDFVVVTNGNYKGQKGRIVEVSDTGKSLWVMPEDGSERFLKRRGNLRKLIVNRY